MIPITKRKIVADVAAYLFSVLFLYTSISKLIDHQQFAGTLRDIPMFSGTWKVVSWAVPIVEIGVVILLYIPKLKSKGLLLSFLLMTAFLGYVLFILVTIDHPPCSCGGVISKMTWRQHVVFNAAFSVVGLIGYLCSRTAVDLRNLSYMESH